MSTSSTVIPMELISRIQYCRCEKSAEFSVTRVNDIMGEIASASEEQQRGIEQVAQAVSQMDQVTQQNASLVEEAAVATEQLANQADHLSSRVAVFTLEEHEVARHESAQLQIAPVVS